MEHEEEPGRFISVGEAATRLRVSKKAVRAGIRRGSIPAVTISERLIRVDWRRVEALALEKGTAVR